MKLILLSVCVCQSVWLQYEAACGEIGIGAVAYKTFCAFWTSLLPHITVMRPMTDLCAVCQQNSTAIMRAANLHEEDKSEVCYNSTCYLIIHTSIVY